MLMTKHCSSTVVGLQIIMNLEKYCNIYNLRDNLDKSKILVIKKGSKLKQNGKQG